MVLFKKSFRNRMLSIHPYCGWLRSLSAACFSMLSPEHRLSGSSQYKSYTKRFGYGSKRRAQKQPPVFGNMFLFAPARHAVACYPLVGPPQKNRRLQQLEETQGQLAKEAATGSSNKGRSGEVAKPMLGCVFTVEYVSKHRLTW